MAAADVPVGSLRSGAGGLDPGVQAAYAGRVAWHSETDPRAAQLSVLGNSVVPHQAAHALNLLIPGGISPHNPTPTYGIRARGER